MNENLYTAISQYNISTCKVHSFIHSFIRSKDPCMYPNIHVNYISLH
jgi:hypothetical protein